MGVHFMDKFSYLHFVSGAVVFYWNISLFHWFLLHTLFEIVENTKFGIHVINTYFKFWPGGKPSADSLMNNLGDTFFALLGWFSAFLVTRQAEK